MTWEKAHQCVPRETTPQEEKRKKKIGLKPFDRQFGREKKGRMTTRTPDSVAIGGKVNCLNSVNEKKGEEKTTFGRKGIASPDLVVGSSGGRKKRTIG